MRDALTVVPDSHKQSQAVTSSHSHKPSQSQTVTTIVKKSLGLHLYHRQILDCIQHVFLALVSWCEVKYLVTFIASSLSPRSYAIAIPILRDTQCCPTFLFWLALRRLTVSFSLAVHFIHVR